MSKTFARQWAQTFIIDTYVYKLWFGKTIIKNSVINIDKKYFQKSTQKSLPHFVESAIHMSAQHYDQHETELRTRSGSPRPLYRLIRVSMAIGSPVCSVRPLQLKIYHITPCGATQKVIQGAVQHVVQYYQALQFFYFLNAPGQPSNFRVHMIVLAVFLPFYNKCKI